MQSRNTPSHGVSDKTVAKFAQLCYDFKKTPAEMFEYIVNHVYDVQTDFNDWIGEDKEC